MSKIVIYHNPHCSKSREALRILEEKGLEPDIILYLESRPEPTELKHLLALLGCEARDIIRKSEPKYKNLGLDEDTVDERQLLGAIAGAPELLERPIIVSGDRAVIGRPPERVLEII